MKTFSAIGLLLLLVALAGVAVMMLPDLVRYLRIRQM